MAKNSTLDISRKLFSQMCSYLPCTNLPFHATCKLVCFKLGLMLNMTRLCSLILVGMTLSEHKGSLKITVLQESKNLCIHFVEKLLDG